MKKIGLITTNKVFAQSLATTIKSMPGLGFELELLMNPNQAMLDAELLGIDVALSDMSVSVGKTNEEFLCFFDNMHKKLPNCRKLLLVSPDDEAAQKMVVEARDRGSIDDYVFNDASLEYLFAKLSAF